MHFRSLIVGAFLLFMGLYVSTSPIPEAAFESYIKIKGAKDSSDPENISVRMRGSRLDGALKVRVSVEVWESLGSSEMHGRYCEVRLEVLLTWY
jgi:hypothetical protein